MLNKRAANRTWQVTNLDGGKLEVRTSRRLYAGTLPMTVSAPHDQRVVVSKSPALYHRLLAVDGVAEVSFHDEGYAVVIDFRYDAPGALVEAAKAALILLVQEVS